MASELSTVYLTKEQAALFILFQGHYDNIAFCIAEGVFDMTGGNAVLSFDPNGKLQTIKKEVFSHRVVHS